MRVLMVTASLALGWGGPTTLLNGLLPALRERGIACDCVAVRGYRVGEPGPVAGAESVRAFGGSAMGRVWTGHARGLAPWLRRVAGQYACVHILELWHFPHFAAARAAWQAGVPYVVSPQGALDDWALGQRRLQKAVYAGLFQRASLRRAGAVHVVAGREAEQVRRFAGQAHMREIGNAVGPEVAPFRPLPPTRLHARFPELRGRRVGLFLARVHPKKGPDLLLRALPRIVAACPDFQLLLAGPDEVGMLPELRRLAAELGVSQRVTFAGPLYGTEKIEALSSASLFALPSYSEGQSVALLEALAAGLPAIVTEAANSPDVAANGAGLVVEPRPEAIAAAAVKLLGDQGLANVCRANGQRLVAAAHTWERVADQFAGLYRELAGSPRVRQEQLDYPGADAGTDGAAPCGLFGKLKTGSTSSR